VKVRAQFDNADNALFPNQFVNAQLLVKTLHNVVTVPTAAIQRGAPGSYVYVINADNRCRSDLSISARPMAQWQRSIPACRSVSGLWSTAQSACATQRA
jgi:multidrug efflux system membrane fusion protein